MHSFIHRHQAKIKGVLSGWDRMRFRGTLRAIAHAWGMKHFLMAAGVYLKDFKGYVEHVSRQVCQATTRLVDQAKRPLVYLPASKGAKEAKALEIARRDGVTHGLIAVFSTVELCWSFNLVEHPQTGFKDIRAGKRKCLHYYHYFLDPDFGLMHARVQTWLPFTIHVCLNGRERLARQLNQAGLPYVKRDNCFVDVSDFAKAQALLDAQTQYKWAPWLEQIARRVQPAHTAIFGDKPLSYYWSINESEFATDLAFRSGADLASLYPQLVRHGIEGLSSYDVLRYLGRKQPQHCPTADVLTEYRVRPEGICVKHRVNQNVIKMYDKEQSVLRVETVINNPEDFKVYRTAEGDDNGTPQWRKMRKGLADIERRAEVSQTANHRYLTGMASVDEKTPLGKLATPLCRPVKWQGRRARALNPLAEVDARLLTAINHGEFAINGFRNRDLRPLLFGDTPVDAVEAKRQSAAVTRLLRLLRAHRLITKVSHTHRYKLNEHRRSTLVALLAARQADTAALLRAG